MAILNLQVGASLDDAFEDGSLALDATSIVVGIYANPVLNNAYICTGARILGVAIPPGAEIITGYSELYVYSAALDDINAVIYGHAVANPLDFDTVIGGGTPHIITEAAEPNGRVRTTASVPWAVDGLGTGWKGSTIELKTIFQELVDLPAWVLGNPVVLLYIAVVAAHKELNARSWDTDPTRAIRVHIEFVDFPDTPSNDTPSNGATGVAVLPTLVSSVYSGDGVHTASQWQVTLVSGDYTAPVFDSGEDVVNLPNIVVAPALSDGVVYYWHVRHKNATGWSAYSAETSFTTTIDMPTNPLTVNLPNQDISVYLKGAP